jgi:predicted nuclease of predicted toxin-antitoxin system
MSERIRYHLDENVSFAIAQGLRRAGIDVTIPREVGLIGKSDMEHLVFANAEKRVLLTHDDDLLVLAHRGYEHYGITYCRKEARSTGQIIRLLILLYEVALADEMKGKIEYL